MKSQKTTAVLMLIAFILGGTAIGLLMMKYTMPVSSGNNGLVTTLELPYEASDLDYIGKGECVVHPSVLGENEGKPMAVEVRKWEGDDIVIVVPNIMLNKLFLDESYIIDGDGLVARVSFGKLSPTDFWLFPDKVLVAMTGIYEFDYDFRQLYGIEVVDLSHRVTPLENGNFAIVRSVLNQAMEINREGEAVWEWNALECILDYDEETYVGYDLIRKYESLTNPMAIYRQQLENQIEWTHLNTLQKLDDGYLIGFRNLDLVVKVNWEGEVVWSFGPLVIKHAHDPHLLDNGNLLIYDNGNGRAIEIDPASGKIIWESSEILAPAMGSVQKLWNGNYLLIDCYRGTIYEVTPENKVLKEVYIKDIWILWARAFDASEVPNYKLIQEVNGASHN